MRIAVLAATGSTGRHLLEQALDRGHTVVALVRNPAAVHLPPGPTLETIQMDVQDGTSIAIALDGVDAVVLEDPPQRLLPRTVSRATVAAAMLDEAENPRYSGHHAAPDLTRHPHRAPQTRSTTTKADQHPVIADSRKGPA